MDNTNSSKNYTLWIILGIVIVVVLIMLLLRKKTDSVITVKDQKIKDIELLLAKVNFDMDEFNKNYLTKKTYVDFSQYEPFQNTREQFKQHNESYKAEPFDAATAYKMM